MKQYDHHHIYERLSNKRTFKCTVPGCTHMINNGPELMVGRRAQCPYCHDTFIITPEHLRRKKLHCLKCTSNGKTIEPLNEAVSQQDEDIIGNLLKEKGL